MNVDFTDYIPVVVLALFLWLPLHLYHYRAAQVFYLIACALLLTGMTLTHFSTLLDALIGSEVLTDDNEHDKEQVNKLKNSAQQTWLASATRGTCGPPCMFFVEFSLAFSLVRLALIPSATKFFSSNEALGVLPYNYAATMTTTTAASVTGSPSSQFVLTGWLKHVSRIDTVLDTILRRSIVLPQLICVTARIVPSWTMGLAISEAPYVMLCCLVWWVKNRKRAVAAAKTSPPPPPPPPAPAAALAAAAGSEITRSGNNNDHDDDDDDNDDIHRDVDDDKKKLVVVQKNTSSSGGKATKPPFLTQHFFVVTLPVMLLVISFAASTGYLLTFMLQLYVDANDWGPRGSDRNWLLAATGAHVILQLVCATRLSWRPIVRVVLLQEKKNRRGGGGVVVETKSVTTTKLHVP